MAVRGARRATVLVVGCAAFPVPLVDTWLQNAVRRWFVGRLSAERGLGLSDAQIAALADEPLAPGRRMLGWLAKRLAGKVFLVVGLWQAVRLAQDTWTLPARVPARGATA